MFSFGSGVLIGTPSGANPTPVNFGLIQEATLDDSATMKPLYGQFQLPVAVGKGTRKVMLKAKAARISGLMLGSLFYGISLTAGSKASAIGEAQTIPATPYQVTVSNAANYVADQGVVYAATGLPLTRVASAPVTGQYSVNTGTGVYTFAAADTTLGVLISYDYTIAATGQKLTITNPLLGSVVNFSALLYTLDPTTGSSLSFRLYNAVMSKLSLGTKLEDWTMPDFEAECYVNAAGNLGDWSWPDKF